MIAFIDDHWGAYGIEPICKVLAIAPSTYNEHVARWRDLDRAPARIGRHAQLRGQIRRVFEDNFRVYGVCEVWR